MIKYRHAGIPIHKDGGVVQRATRLNLGGSQSLFEPLSPGAEEGDEVIYISTGSDLKQLKKAPFDKGSHETVRMRVSSLLVH